MCVYSISHTTAARTYGALAVAWNLTPLCGLYFVFPVAITDLSMVT